MKKLIILLTLFLSTHVFADGLHYGLASFRCFDNLNKNYTEFWIRVKYNKTIGSESAPPSELRQFIWYNARQYFEADTTTFNLHCGNNGAKGQFALFDLTEEKSLEELETRFKYCQQHQYSKTCINKSPLTAYDLPAFDSSYHFAQGDINDDPSLCHGAAGLRCMTPEGNAIDFFIHYTYDRAMFKLGNTCKTNGLTLGMDYYWTIFSPKLFEWTKKLVQRRLNDVVDICRGGPQIFWAGSGAFNKEGYNSKSEALADVDKFLNICENTTHPTECSKLQDFQLKDEDFL